MTPWAIGSYVHGIFQARILEWVAISFSRVYEICDVKYYIIYILYIMILFMLYIYIYYVNI